MGQSAHVCNLRILGCTQGLSGIWQAGHERMELTTNVFTQDGSRDLVIRGSQDAWVIARQVGSGQLLMAMENGADSNLLEVSRRADALSARLLMDKPV